MCELFAMSSRLPTTVNTSLETFAARGGLKGPNHDGWGVAYYEGRAVRVVKEAEPAASSQWVRFIESRSIRSDLVIGHIRHATRGRLSFANTHPFVRELGGYTHVFAHNGDLPGIESTLFVPSRFRPTGETDSEKAFCSLLGQLEDLWLAGGVPPLQERFCLISEFAAVLRTLGPANFVYADGHSLFLHGDRRRYEAEKPPRAPGLQLLEQKCDRPLESTNDGNLEDGAAMEKQRVVLAASVPLTNDLWRPLAEGELVVVSAGEICFTSK